MISNIGRVEIKDQEQEKGQEDHSSDCQRWYAASPVKAAEKDFAWFVRAKAATEPSTHLGPNGIKTHEAQLPE